MTEALVLFFLGYYAAVLLRWLIEREDARGG